MTFSRKKTAKVVIISAFFMFGLLFVRSVFADTASIPPADVKDLQATATSTTWVQFAWTAPGADGMSELAASYDMRMATANILPGNWNAYAKVSGIPMPGNPGTQENFTVSGLSPATAYYFAVRGVDGFGAMSAAFNVAAVTTAAAPSPVTLSNVSFSPKLEGAAVTTQYFTITLYQPGTVTKATEFLAAADGAGKIAMPGNISLNAGPYDIAAASQYYLRKKLNGYNLTSGASVTLPVLPAGDLNSDNTVNALDWSVMSGAWFQTTNAKCDLNKDGIVNSLDWSFLARNWFTTGD